MNIFNIKELITEAKDNYSTSRANIIRSSTILIAHMMKCISDTKMSSGWLGTIFNQSKELNKINKPSHWATILKEINNDNNIYNEIMAKSCSLYIDDFKGRKNQQDAVNAFNIVTVSFPINQIDCLKNEKAIWKFLYTYATNMNDYDTLRLLDQKYGNFRS